MANMVRAQLSKALNLAEIWGWRPEGSNPCRHVKLYKSPKRERFLSETELARLSGILAEAERTQSESLRAVTALRLLMLNGCRVSEISNLRWQDVDFEGGVSDSQTPRPAPLRCMAWFVHFASRFVVKRIIQQRMMELISVKIETLD